MFTNLPSINNVSNHGFKFSISLLGPTLRNADEVYKQVTSVRHFTPMVSCLITVIFFFFRLFSFDNIIDVAKIFIDS